MDHQADAVSWLGRKVAWGFQPGQRETWDTLGPDAVVDLLVDPAGSAIAVRPDPFQGIELEQEPVGKTVRDGVLAWMEHAVTSTRPLETFMEFFWHDFFAVSARVVRPRHWIFGHMRLLARHALGNYGDLLREVTLDPAMLSFLDGRLSTRDRPNENYARELLELYSMGDGHFTEEDVKSAARALTGWRVSSARPVAAFVVEEHDSEPQVLLGVSGVNDVESTISAILSHPQTAGTVVRKLADAILGRGHNADLDPVVESFKADWEIRPVIRSLLEIGVAGERVPSVLPPVAWYVTARRFPTVEPHPVRFQQFFRAATQMVLFPPNVGGFPEDDAYLSAAATIARFNFASHLAERSNARAAGQLEELTDDVDALARQLGLTGGFRVSTRRALKGLEPGIARVAIVLSAPDLMVV